MIYVDPDPTLLAEHAPLPLDGSWRSIPAEGGLRERVQEGILAALRRGEDTLPPSLLALTTPLRDPAVDRVARTTIYATALRHKGPVLLRGCAPHLTVLATDEDARELRRLLCNVESV